MSEEKQELSKSERLKLRKANKAYLDCSNGVEDVYDFAYDDKHVLKVVMVGQRDVDAEIQSYADSCGMDFVLRSVAAGDMSVLNARQGVYGDFTDAPQSLAQVQVQQQAADLAFSELPDTIKNGRSASDVISLTQEQLDDYIKKAVESQLTKQEAPVNEQ